MANIRRWSEHRRQLEQVGQAVTAEYIALNQAQMTYAKALGMSPLEYCAAMQNNNPMVVRGMCEVCSAADRALYTATVRSSDGVSTALETCMDCQGAIRG